MKSIFGTQAEDQNAFTIRLSGETQKKKDTPSLTTPKNYGQLPVDIYENENEILVVTPIAGMDLESTEIIINHDVLIIEGKRTLDDSLGLIKSKKAYLQECFWGYFQRSIILPEEAETDNINATEKNHILYISIPKKVNVNMRIVKIKSK